MAAVWAAGPEPTIARRVCILRVGFEAPNALLENLDRILKGAAFSRLMDSGGCNNVECERVLAAVIASKTGAKLREVLREESKGLRYAWENSLTDVMGKTREDLYVTSAQQTRFQTFSI